MWERIQNILVVTVIAVAMWLYAASQTVEKKEEMISLQFVPPTGRQLIIDPTKPSEPIRLTIRGNQAELAKFRELLLRLPFSIEVRDNVNDPYQQLDLMQELKAYEPLVKTNVEIMDVRPPSIKVRVEAFQEREVLINVPDVEGIEIVSIMPKQAKIRLPTSLAAKITEGTRVTAVLDPEALRKLQANVQQTVNVPLVLPPELRNQPNVTLTPRSAKVALTIQGANTKQNVPVYLSAPPAALADYEVRINNKSFITVELTGPTEVIERIEKMKAKVRAVLVLDTEQLERASRNEKNTGSLAIIAPSGVSVVQPPEQVTFVVTKRPKPKATE